MTIVLAVIVFVSITVKSVGCGTLCHTKNWHAI